MATTYYSWTIPMDDAEVSPDPAPNGMLPDEIGEAMGQPGAIATGSRNDWLHFMLRKGHEALGGSELAFLIKDPESLPDINPGHFRPAGSPGSGFETQEVCVVTKLPHADIAPAIAKVDAWFEAAATRPELFPQMLGENCSREDAARAIEASMDLREEFGNEDGDDAVYLFGFLKSLRSMMQEAMDSGMAVVHVRFSHISRRVAQ